MVNNKSNVNKASSLEEALLPSGSATLQSDATDARVGDFRTTSPDSSNLSAAKDPVDAETQQENGQGDRRDKFLPDDVGMYVETTARAMFLPEPVVVVVSTDDDAEEHDGNISTTEREGLTEGEEETSPRNESEVEATCFDNCLSRLIQYLNCCNMERTSTNQDYLRESIKFVLTVALLQVSYLMWGYQQELIMTTRYTPTERSPDGRFPSASFCVLCNRLAAVVVSAAVVTVRHGVMRGLLFPKRRASLAGLLADCHE